MSTESLPEFKVSKKKSNDFFKLREEILNLKNNHLRNDDNGNLNHNKKLKRMWNTLLRLVVAVAKLKNKIRKLNEKIKILELEPTINISSSETDKSNQLKKILHILETKLGKLKKRRKEKQIEYDLFSYKCNINYNKFYHKLCNLMERTSTDFIIIDGVKYTFTHE